MSRRQLCRRKFLEAIGIGAALSPFVPYLNRDAEAASQAFPKRLVLTFAPNGTVLMFFRDPGGSAGPSLFTIDISGRNELKVPTPGFASDPAWSPLLS